MTKEEFNEAMDRLSLTKQKDIADFFGISRSKAGEYKNGSRSVPKYVAISVQGHLLLSSEQISTLKQLRGVV